MNLNSLVIVLERLTGEEIQHNPNQENLSISCPLAPYRHKNGTDKSKGFTVGVKDSTTSPCYCWSCGFRGNLLHLAKELSDLGQDMTWFRDLVREHETPGTQYLLDAINHEDKPIKVSKKIWTDDDLAPYPLLTTVKETYRGLSAYTLNELQFRIDNKQKRVAMPIITKDGIVGMTGRTLTNSHIKYLNYTDKGKFSKGVYLFNEQLLTPGVPVHTLLVEGPLDAAWAFQVSTDLGLDITPVACMGSSLTKTQVSKLVQSSNKITLMLDNDKSGQLGTFKAINQLLEYGIPLYVYPYAARFKDVGELQPNELAEILTKTVEVTKDEYDSRMIQKMLTME